jgi:hypothetical protein
LREARAAATPDHPHICSMYWVGEPEAPSTSRCNTSRAKPSTRGCARTLVDRTGCHEQHQWMAGSTPGTGSRC